MENIVGMFKFSDFELKFLRNIDIELQGDKLVNLNTGESFKALKTKKSYDYEENEQVDCYIFECNGILIECRRLYNKPTKVSIYVNSRKKTYFGGEFIDCNLKKNGCDCNLDDAYKHLIIGFNHKLRPDRTIQAYVNFDPKLDDDITCRITVSRFINNESSISSHVVDCTDKEIFDDVLNCHGYRSKDTKPIGVLGNPENFKNVMTSAIHEECRIDSTTNACLQMFAPFFGEAYTRTINYAKGNQEKCHKK